MCGICGIVSTDRPGVEPQVRAMMAALVHRGPDDEGYEQLPLGGDDDPVVGLGFRRLSILDLSPSGHQPMVHPGTGDCLVFNGEIYNFRELRLQLQLQGAVFRSTGDTEVLLQALVAWGEEALARVEGMFACAWYDRRRQRLVLARDRHGIKPLYWTHGPHRFAFASEIKALHTLPWLDRRLDLRALMSHLSLLCSTHDMTMFSAVRKLEPGHMLCVPNSGGISIGRFAQPPFSRPAVQMDRRSAAAACRDVLAGAVERQMVADVTVGGFLSGGVDSTAVASLAREHVRPTEKFPVFTVVLEEALRQTGDGFADDLPYAARVAASLGLPLVSVTVDEAQIADIDALVWQLDEPIADPAAANVDRICSVAAVAGVKVLLSGTGADDIFTGYRRHTALKMERFWRWWPRLARRVLQGAGRTFPASLPSGRRFSRLVRDALLSDDERMAGYFLWLDTARVRSLLSPAALAAIGDWSPEVALRESLAQVPAGTARLNRMLALERLHFLADHNLVYTDKMSMAHGIEVRVPYLDDRVVDFAERLPPAVKARGWGGKAVLRDAVVPLVPRETLTRPKTGFGVNLRRLITTAFADRLRRLGDAPSGPCAEIFSGAALRELVRDNDSGRVDAAYPLFAVLCIESWCRQFGATW